MSIATATMKRSPSPKMPGAESLRLLIDAIPQIVWTNNVDGTASYFNRRWYEYTGLNYEQSAGHGWQAVIHPDDVPASRERWQVALETASI
jgi:PAS domain S-box-containing protein